MVIPMYSNESEIKAAGALIRAGRVVVFPTETVYGLGANALDADAVAAIFATKGRPADNPLIVHLAGISQIGLVASEISSTAHRLLEEFAPGPLTVILPARADLPRVVTAGLDTVAVRVPAHPVAQALLRAAQVPVAAPSANRSGEPSPTTMEMARQSLGDRPALYLDGGPCAVGLESTVLSVIHDQIRILRPGAVTEADILALLPDVTVHSIASGVGLADPARDGGEDGSGGRGFAMDPARDGGGRVVPAGAESPGLRHRHYQPKAQVSLWETAGRVRTLLARSDRTNHTVMVISPVSMKPAIDQEISQAGGRVVVRSYVDLAEYARGLYAWFAEGDDAGVATIIAHLPARDGLGAALRDRLTRASGEA
jgi:L-threonylcarbamoyladenylate synthase